MRRLVLALLLCCTLLFAQGKGKGKENKDKPANPGGKSTNIAVSIFSDRDRGAIHDYYWGGASSLPPGLAKRGGDLPPGLQKQLTRKGQLPPGLEKKLDPFPRDLEGRLPPLCGGCRRGMLGTQALIIDATNVVLDIIDLTRR
jgi:hypothetical protein